LQQEEMKHEIGKFVLTKGFCNKPEVIPKKFRFTFIELGQAKVTEENCKRLLIFFLESTDGLGLSSS